MARNNEIFGKWEMHTVGPGLWRENWKTWKMRQTHCSFQSFLPYTRSYNVLSSFFSFVIFLAIFRILQCVFLIFHVFQCFSPYSISYSWYMARNTEKGGEMRNTHCRTWNMAINTEKRGKWEIHNLGPKICQKTL